MERLCIFPFYSEILPMVKLRKKIKKFDLCAVCGNENDYQKEAIKVLDSEIKIFDELEKHILEFDGILVPDLMHFSEPEKLLINTVILKMKSYGKTVRYINEQGKSLERLNIARCGRDINVPVVTILKEVTSIRSMELILNLIYSFEDSGICVGVISNCIDSSLIENFINIPDFMLESDVAGEKKIQLFHDFVLELLDKHPYDLLIIDGSYGLLQQEHENISLLPFELLKAVEPDFLIMQILAGNYSDLEQLKYELEIIANHKINALVLTNMFFDIIKYNDNGKREFLYISDSVRVKLMDKLSEIENEIVFSSKSILKLYNKIIEDMSSSIGECRKVCLYE